MNEQNGKWVTIHGHRVFIKDKNAEKKKEVANKIFNKEKYVKDEGSIKFTGSEYTGGGVMVYAGSVGNYDFIASDGSIEYFDKKHKMTIEKYLDLEDDAWNGKYGPDIGGAYDFEQKYAKYGVVDPKIEQKILDEVNKKQQDYYNNR